MENIISKIEFIWNSKRLATYLYFRKNSSTAQLPLRKLEGSQPLGYLTVSSRANNKTAEPITESGGEKLDFVRILN